MNPSTPCVSIGILAHNEAASIGSTLESLFQQDAFSPFDTEVIVVANGCSDETVGIAQAAIDRHRATWSFRGSARVEDLPTPGKANAWNVFVHELSAPGARLLVLMDADIRFVTTGTASRLIDALDESPSAVVSVGQPVKVAGPRAGTGLVQRLLARETRPLDPEAIPLADSSTALGRRSCAPFASRGRSRWRMASSGALLLTRGFTIPEDRRRIVLASGASHAFEVVDSVTSLFRHERWVVSGSIVNMVLFARFGREARPGRSAGDLMAEWSLARRAVVAQAIDAEVRSRGLDLLPGDWWTRRWARLRQHPWRRRIARVPGFAAAALFDAVVFLAAIREVKSGRGFGYRGDAERRASATGEAPKTRSGSARPKF